MRQYLYKFPSLNLKVCTGKVTAKDRLSCLKRPSRVTTGSLKVGGLSLPTVRYINLTILNSNHNLPTPSLSHVSRDNRRGTLVTSDVRVSRPQVQGRSPVGQATVQSPNAVARTLSSALKRPITAKAVRSMARATIGRFDKSRHPEYQSHAYTAAEVTSLRKAFETRGQRSAAQPVRKASAAKSKASKPRARKAPVTTEVPS